jgi:predicted nucleotide-binding protein
MEHDAAAELLKRQIENGERVLSQRPISRDAFSQWITAARSSVEWIYGTDSDTFRSYKGSGGIASVPINPSETWRENDRAETMERHISKLKGMLDFHSATRELQKTASSAKNLPSDPTRVFVVHGHDDRYRIETARFLEHLGLTPIILHEQANAGRTLIDKFEESAIASGFAVVLLTPDDRGGVANLPRVRQRARARQNVIFELGYFIRKFGRSRVCALYVPGIELPSDIHGVAYIELDSAGAWKPVLARELSAALLPVDPHALMG